MRPLPDAQARAFQALLARRRQLVEMRVAEQNRLGAAADPAVRQDLRAHIAWLARRGAALDAELHAAIQASPVWRAKDDLLRGVPGIGPGTARVLLAELPELGTLTGKQVAALAGLAPVARAAARGPSPAAAPPSAAPCTWPRCPPPATTRRCAPSATACGPPARSRSWSWSPSPASSWSSSTPCSATTGPGTPN